MQLGAHIVVYSATKHIDGQGRCLGGVILSDKKWIDENLHDYFRHTGPSLSPFNAWTLLKGLETLPLRVRQQTESAGKIADFLAERPEIARVIYPGRADHPQADIVKKQMSGGSTLICLDVKGGKQAAFALQNALDIVLISNNLGDAKSLITHPATTTHKNLSDEARAELGIGPGTLRLSVGLEDTDDLLEDIEQALKRQIAEAAFWPSGARRRLFQFGCLGADGHRVAAPVDGAAEPAARPHRRQDQVAHHDRRDHARRQVPALGPGQSALRKVEGRQHGNGGCPAG